MKKLIIILAFTVMLCSICYGSESYVCDICDKKINKDSENPFFMQDKKYANILKRFDICYKCMDKINKYINTIKDSD